MVVYGPHGLGLVVARANGRVQGAEQELVVLEFDDGLTVSLPIEHAQEQLRALASDAEIGRVQETLREEHAVSNEPWLTRRRDAHAKLTSGNPVGLAEILRDGAARERSQVARGGNGVRSSRG
jgi:RNA polymerase-interacting CarD/CdnL/TRCF family regulator